MEPVYTLHGHQNAEDHGSFLGQERPAGVQLPHTNDSGPAQVHYGARSQSVQHKSPIREP